MLTQRFRGTNTVPGGCLRICEAEGAEFVPLSVVSHFAFAVDGNPFFIFGERPEDYDVILLRSKTHFRDYCEPMADRILVVEMPDLGPADVRLIPYRQLDTAETFPWSDAPA